jgi:Ser/Thr protein kinase RdoA (MazF antagonist)
MAGMPWHGAEIFTMLFVRKEALERMLHTLLREHYGLQVTAIEPFALGVVNRNYRVRTGAGDFALKQYSDVSRDSAQRSAAVQERVRAAGLPAPAILPNRDGDLATVTEAGTFVLMALAPGHHLEGRTMGARPARAMGATLGRLDRVLAEMEAVPPMKLPDREAALARLERLLRAAEAHRSRSPVDEAACLILRQKIDRLSAFDVSMLPAELPAQWVHGDYQATNVLFSPEDEVTAVLDFDNLRRLHRGLDFMRTVEVTFTDGRLLPVAYDFLAGYLPEVDADEAEVAMYAHAGAYQRLTRDWPVGARYEEPERYDPRWDRFIVYRPDWWGQEPERVAEAFLRVKASL